MFGVIGVRIARPPIDARSILFSSENFLTSASSQPYRAGRGNSLTGCRQKRLAAPASIVHNDPARFLIDCPHHRRKTGREWPVKRATRRKVYFVWSLSEGFVTRNALASAQPVDHPNPHERVFAKSENSHPTGFTIVGESRAPTFNEFTISRRLAGGHVLNRRSRRPTRHRGRPFC
jgi:hypothetical protein